MARESLVKTKIRILNKALSHSLDTCVLVTLQKKEESLYLFLPVDAPGETEWNCSLFAGHHNYPPRGAVTQAISLRC